MNKPKLCEISAIVNNQFLSSEYDGKDWESVRKYLIKDLKKLWNTKVLKEKRSNICKCEELKNHFVHYRQACPLHGDIKSMEEVILNFQKENIDRIMFKSEGRTPLRFPLAQDLKNAGYVHKSEIIK